MLNLIPDFTDARGQQLALQLVEQLPAAAYVLDPKGQVLIWNQACERLTGLPTSEVVCTNTHWQGFFGAARPCLADLLLQQRTGEIDTLFDRLPAAIDDRAASAGAWCIPPRMGRELYLLFEASLVVDAAGEIVAVVEIVRDATAAKRAEAAYGLMAASDALTGLANRPTFDRMLQVEWQRAQREGSALSLLLIDIDCLALYNDTYGIDLGDRCLQAVAQTLGACLHGTEAFAARYNPAKFAAILPDTSMGASAQMAEAIRQALAGRRLAHRTSGAAPFVSLSIGVASGTTLDTQPEQLLADAEMALARAKREGRNRCAAARAGRAISAIDAVDDRPTTREALRRRRDLRVGI